MEHPNAYLTFDTQVPCCAIADNMILPVFFNIKLKILTQSTDVHIVDIAHQRLKTMLEEILPYSVFVDRNDETGELAYETDSKIVDLDGQPHDYTVAKALFWKLNAILEGHLIIENVQISSNISDGLTCNYTGFIDEDTHQTFELPSNTDWAKELSDLGLNQPWWHRSDSSTSNVIVIDEDQEFVLCNQIPSWEEYELLWDQPKPSGPGEVVRMDAFKPKVIFGSKKDD